MVRKFIVAIVFVASGCNSLPIGLREVRGVENPLFDALVNAPGDIASDIAFEAFYGDKKGEGRAALVFQGGKIWNTRFSDQELFECAKIMSDIF